LSLPGPLNFGQTNKYLNYTKSNRIEKF